MIKRYIDEDKDEYRFRFTLGELDLRNNQIDASIAVYQGIVSDDGMQPNGLKARTQLAAIYLRTGKVSVSRELVDAVLVVEKNNENALLLKARLNLTEGKYDDAITNLRTVLRDNPTSINALRLIGESQAEMGATNLAVESFSRAFETYPATPEVANPLASILMRSNKPEEADEVLSKSIAAGNQTTEALRLSTQVKMMLGEWGQAEELAQCLNSIEGEEALSQQVLGQVYRSREQQDESIAAFKRAHELDPQAFQPVMALVQDYLRNNKIDEARSFLLSVVTENPKNAIAYQLLGQLSLAENDVPAAIGYYERVIEADPRLETGYRSLASICTGINKPKKAEAILQQGLLKLPGNVALTVNLAVIFERRGDYDRAIELYEASLVAQPDLIIAKNNLAS